MSLTIRELSDLLGSYEYQYQNGEDTEVWIDNGNGTSSPIRSARPLNEITEGKVMYSDILLSTEEQ